VTSAITSIPGIPEEIAITERIKGEEIASGGDNSRDNAHKGV